MAKIAHFKFSLDGFASLADLISLQEIVLLAKDLSGYSDLDNNQISEKKFLNYLKESGLDRVKEGPALDEENLKQQYGTIANEVGGI